MDETTKSTSSPASSETTTVNLHAADDNQSKSDQTANKRRRSLPGMPDPNAEVIALSPKSLQATNKFVCEICNKGFQRDQNLQLHRRGHNLPWKLRQRNSTEVRKRVYVCPEPSCVHHDPSRALGDLTGIKKHYSRKHGEKKFKCEKCSKKYAVQSDWKAHMKTCGSKEYRCDCGTLFSRRDSFVTHRAFCDALAQESARSQPTPSTIPASPADNSKLPEVGSAEAAPSTPPPPATPSTGVLSSVLSIQSSAENQENPTTHQISLPPAPPLPIPSSTTSITTNTSETAMATAAPSSSPNACSSSQINSVFSNILSPSSSSQHRLQNPHHHHHHHHHQIQTCCVIDPISLSLSSSLNGASSLLQQQHYVSPALSATALLQKAAQIGATSSSSFLRGLGMSVSSSHPPTTMASIAGNNTTWADVVKLESSSVMTSYGLELGLPSSRSATNTMFGNKPATLDFLGLGSNARTTATFMSSVNGGLDFNGELSGGGGSSCWNGSSSAETKPSML